MHAVTKNILKFTATGLVAGVVLGWLLSLPSGNYFVTLGIDARRDLAEDARSSVQGW
jgi:hypothetical protein